MLGEKAQNMSEEKKVHGPVTRAVILGSGSKPHSRPAEDQTTGSQGMTGTERRREKLELARTQFGGNVPLGYQSE